MIRPSLQHALDAITGGPAPVRNGRMDIIAANPLGRALYVDACTSTARPVNIARHAFLNRDRSELFYPDWDLAADQIVAILRTEAGRDPHDKDLQDPRMEASHLHSGTRFAHRLLASWAATQEQDTATVHDKPLAINDI